MRAGAYMMANGQLEDTLNAQFRERMEKQESLRRFVAETRAVSGNEQFRLCMPVRDLVRSVGGIRQALTRLRGRLSSEPLVLLAIGPIYLLVCRGGSARP